MSRGQAVHFSMRRLIDFQVGLGKAETCSEQNNVVPEAWTASPRRETGLPQGICIDRLWGACEREIVFSHERDEKEAFVATVAIASGMLMLCWPVGPT